MLVDYLITCAPYHSTTGYKWTIVDFINCIGAPVTVYTPRLKQVSFSGLT